MSNPDIRQKSRFLSWLGDPRRNIAICCFLRIWAIQMALLLLLVLQCLVGYGKTGTVWLPDGERFLQMFIRFNKIHERDRQRDTRTDGHRTNGTTA